MSTLVKIFMCIIVLVLTPGNYVVKGAGTSSISYGQIKDDFELERQLLILKQSPVKTIQTREGQIFDCIDLYKQPAFENPLLKDHKIQVRPTSSPSTYTTPSNEKKLKSSKANKLSSDVDVLKRLDCPQGSAPIRRTIKKYLTRSIALSKSIYSTNGPDLKVAYWRTKDGSTKIIHGAKGDISIYNPTVENGQYSGAQIWIEAAGFEDLETIQAGWAVAPSIYGDNLTHVTTYWRGNKNGCHNILCPGFVQVDKDFALGDVIDTISKYDKEQFTVHIYIYQDRSSGHWWLKGGSEDRNIGYWPKELFSHLSNGANSIAWGGIVKDIPNGPSPQMGNGYFPDHSYYKAASVTNLEVLTENYEFEYSEEDYESFVDKPECYNLEYDGYVGKKQGLSLLFGGPGGNNCGN